MPSFFEEVDGVRIHYEKVGNGPQTLLLIPGAIGKLFDGFLVRKVPKLVY